MARTVVALYDDIQTAHDVLQALSQEGFYRDDMSVIGYDPEGRYADYIETEVEPVGESEVAAGAGIGAVIGAIGGLMVGLSALVVPGVGPVIAAGSIATTLLGAGVGAVAGGLIGALVEAGVPEEEAEYYAEAVRRGGYLVLLNTVEDRVPEAVEVMNRYNPADVETRTVRWREQGWAGYEAEAEPYTYEAVETERSYWAEREVSGAEVTPYTKTSPESEPVDREDVAESPPTRTEPDADEVPPVGAVNKAPHTRSTGGEGRAAVSEAPHTRTKIEEGEYEYRPYTRVYEEGEQVPPEGYYAYEPLFYRHYRTTYGTTGQPYNWYSPGYRYGYVLATEPTYRTRTWEEIEPEARERWEEEYDLEWDQFQETVVYSWDEVRRATR